MCVCDENLLPGMKMFRKTLTFRKTSRKIIDIYVSAALVACPRFPFMHDANLQFCKQSVHSLAPKIQIFITHRIDILYYPRINVFVSVCRTSPANPLHISYHTLSTIKKNHSPPLHLPQLCHRSPSAAASPVPQSILRISLTTRQHDSLTHWLNCSPQQRSSPA